MGRSRQIIAAWCLCLLTLPGMGQVADGRYLVYFADKADTPHSIGNPSTFLAPRAIARRANQGIAIDERDLPVSPQYVDMVKALGEVRVVYPVKWFNAILIETHDPEVVAAIGQLPAVTGVQLSTYLAADDTFEAAVEVAAAPKTGGEYGVAFNQIDMINGTGLHHDGYRGEGMLIGVFDGGFALAEESVVIHNIFEQGGIAAAWNLVEENNNAFARSTHGTRVLSTMASYSPELMVGTAPMAQYVLAITEDVALERRIEEVLWAIAAEWADSMGVDVINTSLGYTDFDVESESYSVEDMDGNTALITRASNIAASRGMLMVTSAGNKGHTEWRIISAPADADRVLSVGAVNPVGEVAFFSSRGPTADGRVKPNVSAQGQGTIFTNLGDGVGTGNGTSFSSPIVAGMAACLWQGFPKASALQVKQAIEASAHLFAQPNDSMGFGIPNFEVARYILDVISYARPQQTGALIYPNPASAGGALWLHLPEGHTKKLSVKIYDIHGRLLRSGGLMPGDVGSPNIDLAPLSGALSPGTYVLHVDRKYGTSKLKIMIQ